MSDRIQQQSELWATKQGFRDLTQHMGRYNRAVVRWMFAAWLEQSERITDYDKFITILSSLELNYHVEITKTGRVTCVLCASAFSLGLNMLDQCIYLNMSTSWLFNLNPYIETRNGNTYTCFHHANIPGAKV